MRHHERRESLLLVYHMESTMQAYFKQQRTKTEDLAVTEITFVADKDKWNDVH